MKINVCGDFNIDQKQEEEYKAMLQNLNATNGDLSGEFQFSYDRSLNDLHVEAGAEKDLLDYILIRNHSEYDILTRKILAFRRPWAYNHADLSDHFALEAEVLIQSYPSRVFSSLRSITESVKTSWRHDAFYLG